MAVLVFGGLVAIVLIAVAFAVYEMVAAFMEDED